MSEVVLERADPAAAETASESHQFVTFLVGGEVFAVDMAPVQEIIRLPDLVRVPLAPPALLGLANLRGKVLPVVSLRRIFGFPEAAHDDSTRALVIDVGQPIAFVVDRVARVIDVEAEQIEPVAGIEGTLDTQLLSGLIKGVGGFSLVMVLDFARIVTAEFAALARATEHHAAAATLTATHAAEAHDEALSDELQLVSFVVAGQEYAVDIAQVQEIVQAPEEVVHVPNAPAHILGLITLRGRLLPLIALRSLFALGTQPLDEKSRVVVIALGGAAVGLVTDSVSEVLRIPKGSAEPLPPLLARERDLGEIAQICRLDGGKRLVSILAVDTMFQHSVVKEALKTVETMNEGQQMQSDEALEASDEEQVVVFRLGSGEFGVPIASVQEIVRVPEALTHVPKAPAFVEGVINLRGAVLPVVDLRKRLDLPPIERNDRQRIMVFLLSGVRTGFIVDAVSEVLKIPHAAIAPSPTLSDEQARLIGRVANLAAQQRMIQLIAPEQLLDPADAAGLAQLGG